MALVTIGKPNALLTMFSAASNTATRILCVLSSLSPASCAFLTSVAVAKDNMRIASFANTIESSVTNICSFSSSGEVCSISMYALAIMSFMRLTAAFSVFVNSGLDIVYTFL